jgi:glycosyltransferase involved in cell wall biosynthesis
MLKPEERSELSPRLKVLHVITGLGGGGAEQSLFKLCSNDSQNRHQVISLRSRGVFAEQLEKVGVPVSVLRISTINWFWRMIQLRRAIVRDRPDVVHAWMPHAILLSSLAIFPLSIQKVFWGLRATDYTFRFPNPIMFLLLRFLAKLSHSIPDVIFAVGQRVKDSHIRIGFAKNKTVVIENGYSDSDNDSQCEDHPSSWVAKPNEDRKPVIGMVARVHAQKDHQNLFDALSIVSKAGLQFSLVLVGAGATSQNQKIVKKLRRNLLWNSTVLLGPKTNLDSVYRTLDFHILSSAFGEGFPNVVAESMCFEVPNIVTDVGEASRIVGSSGWVVPPREPAKLAQAIIDALSLGPIEKKERGIRARERIISTFPLKEMIRTYNHYYSAPVETSNQRGW